MKKSLSTRTHRNENAAKNILRLALQARDGQSLSNAVGVATSTLVGENLLQQVATLITESPRMRVRGVSKTQLDSSEKTTRDIQLTISNEQ